MKQAHFSEISQIKTEKSQIFFVATRQKGVVIRSMFQYKGYTGELEIDIESGMLSGRVIDIKDVVSFKGKTVEETRQAFEESVDDYLEFCAELGEEPDKPFSGKLPFRTSPEHHRKIFIASRKVGKSINAWMDETLVKAAEEIIHA